MKKILNYITAGFKWSINIGKILLNYILLGLQWLVLTNIGRILLGFIAVVLGNVLQQSESVTINNIGFYLTWVSVAYLAGYVLLFMAFAWIINPLKDRGIIK